MARKELAVDSVAEAYLTLLAERGVEYLFANAGTDFAPLVEAFAKAARTGTPVPRPVIATHENLALSMAHGYAMVTGRVPAVIVHVSVGAANGRVRRLQRRARERSAHNLPVLFVIMNNSMWGAVRRATSAMYPQGEAMRSNKPPLIDLDDLPAFEQVCAAAGGYGERVEDPAGLPGALERALHAVTIEKRQALLNVVCRGP